MWNACNQEETCISLVSNKKEEEEDDTSNVYYAHHKKMGVYKKFKGPKEKVDLFKIECYNYHKMGHYKNQCPENPRNKKSEREHATVADEAPPKKKKTKESKVKDLFS